MSSLPLISDPFFYAVAVPAVLLLLAQRFAPFVLGGMFLTGGASCCGTVFSEILHTLRLGRGIDKAMGAAHNGP